MREQFSQFSDQWVRWCAVVVRFGVKRRDSDVAIGTIMLKDVRSANNSKVRASHCWIDTGPWSEGLKAGDVIYFDALVRPYRHGDPRAFWNEADVDPRDFIDYKLTRPRNVVKVKEDV